MGWHGMDEVMSRLSAMTAQAESAARTVAVGGAALVEASAKRNFQGSHRKGSPHVGGQAPNVVTGNLRRSIHTTAVRSLGVGVFTTTVGPTVLYGRRVELGYAAGTGVGHGGTRAFPYFKPGVDRSKPALEALQLTVWSKIGR